MQWVDQLPKEGVAIFVVDDPINSSDDSVELGAYIDNPRILALGAENYVGPPHPKIIQMPVGLESKLMAGWNGRADALVSFVSMTRSPIPYHERKYDLVSDAHLHIFQHPASGVRNDRQEMIDGVQKSAVDKWYEKHIPMREHLSIVANSRLSLCPEGSGVDCHRFYHNYALGLRCVIKKGALTRLHSQFPGTVVVDSWADVTEMNVSKWLKENPPERDMRLLTANYWINKVLRVAQQQPVTIRAGHPVTKSTNYRWWYHGLDMAGSHVFREFNKLQMAFFGIMVSKRQVLMASANSAYCRWHHRQAGQC